MIFLLTAAFFLLILMEAPKLVRQKSWRELTVYSVLMVLAYTVCVLELLGVPIPNPVKDTQYLVKSLLHLSYD